MPTPAHRDNSAVPRPDLADAYLAVARSAKYRRLSGLIALCAMLLAVLVTIYIQGWYQTSGGGSAGWVICGIVVSICAIGGVVVDILYRKDL